MGVSKCTEASKHMGHSNVWGHIGTLSLTKHAFFLLYMYSRHPNIWGASKHMGGIQTYRRVSKHGRHTNIHGVIQTYRASKHTGVSKYMGPSKCMGAYGHPLSLTKHVLFVLYMYSRNPNIFQTYGGIQTYGSVHTYSGGIQT